MDQKKTKEAKDKEIKDSPQKTAEKKNPEQEKIDDLTDTLKRLQAEFENYKKRSEKEKAEFSKFAKAPLLQKVLSIIDTFEIALKNNHQQDSFSKGMEMIYAQMISLLESEGVRKIESVGKMCDPHYHEVMFKEESEREEGTVLEELQKGYMLYDKILRYSKVKVSKNKVTSPNKDESRDPGDGTLN